MLAPADPGTTLLAAAGTSLVGAIVPLMRLTIVMVADIPSGAQEGFQEYESAVLPLLPRHGGRLERRLRTGDALTEVHIVSFKSQEGLESYLADEERQAHMGLLDGLDVAQRVLLVEDV
jgi:uncharacterized protein (DUF1330 family)